MKNRLLDFSCFFMIALAIFLAAMAVNAHAIQPKTRYEKHLQREFQRYQFENNQKVYEFEKEKRAVNNSLRPYLPQLRNFFRNYETLTSTQKFAGIKRILRALTIEKIKEEGQ